MTLTESARSRLRNQHEAIPFIVGDLTQTALRSQPIPDKWSIHEQVAHLARYQEVFPDRIRLILHENNPVFTRYNALEDPNFPKWVALPWLELWSGLVAGRQKVQEVLFSLQPQALDRTAYHPLYGSIPIPFWVEFFLLHEAHHLFSILQLVGRIRLTPPPMP